MTDDTIAHAELRPVAVSELHESPDNPRRITPERLQQLVASLRADPSMLDARPLVATPEGEVVMGNMRLRAARQLGWETVPVYVKSFKDEAQKREWALKDNNPFGEWIPDELRGLVLVHRDEGHDLSLLGFGDQELRDLLTVDDGGALPDAPVQDVPVVFGVVIDCDSEAEQAELLEEFAGRNLKCRALMA